MRKALVIGAVGIGILIASLTANREAPVRSKMRRSTFASETKQNSSDDICFAENSTVHHPTQPPCEDRIDRLASEPSQDALLRALETERDEAVVLGLLYRLGAVGDEQAADALEAHAKSPDGFHAAAAIGALRDIAERTKLEDVAARAKRLADEALALENADPIFPIAASLHGVELETFVKGLAERGHAQAQQWMAQKTPFSEPCGRRNP